MSAGTFPHFEKAFASVGWFLPPYVTIGFLSLLAAEIHRAGNSFTQQDLEAWLSRLYEPESLAAMVSIRYPETPIICEYKKTIAEAIEAHFLGLHHVAVGGLVPVLEGAGRELLSQRGLPAAGGVRSVFSVLANDCRQESLNQGIGATGEVISMMDSFAWFTRNVMYVDSGAYLFLDKTNRHGITHGAYKDQDYGHPINFYKTIGAIDFLCFVSAFRARISWFAPSPNDESKRLAAYYRGLQNVSLHRGKA